MNIWIKKRERRDKPLWCSMKSSNPFPKLNPNSRMLPSYSVTPTFNLRHGICHTSCRGTFSVRAFSSITQNSLRYAVLGAGFAGLSVVWHLLKHSPKELHLRVDLYDEVGIGGGASGVAGGLLHPYSPKVKLLWKGAQCWEESIKLLRVAEEACLSKECKNGESKAFIAHKRGILRPAMNMKNLNQITDNVQTCLASCRIDALNKEEVQNLVPSLRIPCNTAFYMPQAVNVHSQQYLQALFWACEDLVNSASGCGQKELNLHKRSVHKLLDFEGEYDAIIICIGAKANMLPEISGRLPLRTCRGVIAHLELPIGIRILHAYAIDIPKAVSLLLKQTLALSPREGYPDHGPSILSDAWIAVQGPRNLHIGSTWEWKSTNSSPNVSADEASKALQELLPKVCSIYPRIKDWVFTGARAGLRAMPPLTSLGSLPILGCINDLIAGNHTCKYWLFGGLGSRGLLYHGWLGNLMAQAVLSSNEEVIPSELTSWKNTKEEFV